MACSKSRSFPDDLNLHDSIDALKVVLFDAIPLLIEILVPEKFCKLSLSSKTDDAPY